MEIRDRLHESTMDKIIKESYTSEVKNSGMFSASEQAIYCAPDVFYKHSFYINLTKNLSPAYTDKLSHMDLLNISEISYFLLRALLAFDTIVDDGVTSNLKLGIFNYEAALVRLNATYPNSDKFWDEFREIKIRYHKASELEKKISLEKSLLSLEEFTYIAEGKSIFVKLIPLMLDSTLGSSENTKKLQQSLLNFHVGLQVLDDIEDFIIDIKKSQTTYANSSIKKHLNDIGIDSDSITTEKLYKYFFASGLALNHLDLAERNFHAALQMIQDTPVEKLKSHILKSGIEQVDSLRDRITRLLPKTAYKSTP